VPPNTQSRFVDRIVCFLILDGEYKLGWQNVWTKVSGFSTSVRRAMANTPRSISCSISFWTASLNSSHRVSPLFNFSAVKVLYSSLNVSSPLSTGKGDTLVKRIGSVSIVASSKGVGYGAGHARSCAIVIALLVQARRVFLRDEQRASGRHFVSTFRATHTQADPV
jgi:hypothetical protein